jgi:hypothetical protein
MRFQYASGRSRLCTLSTGTTGGSISAGTYYFWLQGRNDVGYTLFSDSSSVTVSESSGGITLTIPSDAYREGENWSFFAISINTVDDPSTSKLLLLVPAVTSSQAPISLPQTLTLTEENHIATEQTVSDLGISVKNGSLREYSVNSNVYRYSSTSTAEIDGSSVISASPQSGRWLLHKDGFSTYITSTEDSELGCDVSVLEIDEDNNVIDINYALDGSEGLKRKFWFYNDTQSTIASGKVFGLIVEVLGQDVTTNFYGFLQTTFKGHWDRTSESLITTLVDGVTDLPYLDITETFDKSQNNLILTRDLEPGQAWILEVYPEFSNHELSANVLPPYGSNIELYGFIYLNSVTSTDLGDFLGDCILPTDPNLRRVVPLAGRAVKVLSGISIVDRKHSGKATESSGLGLASNTADQLIVLGSNGGVYVDTVVADTEALRAKVSTVAGYSHVSVGSSGLYEGATTATFDVNLTYPDSIRPDYPDVIANDSNGEFNISGIRIFIVRKDFDTEAFYDVKVTDLIYVADPFPTSISIDYSTLNDFDSNTFLSLPQFGLWEPSQPSITDVGTGSIYKYQAYCQYYYDGNIVTGIDHKPSSGCIQEISSQFSSVFEEVNYWKTISYSRGTLSAISASYLVDGARYPVISTGDVYVYSEGNTETPDGIFVVSCNNGSGNFLLENDGGPYRVFSGEATSYEVPLGNKFYLKTDVLPYELYYAQYPGTGNLGLVGGSSGDSGSDGNGGNAPNSSWTSMSESEWINMSESEWISKQ